jgi:hypothetical protein
MLRRFIEAVESGELMANTPQDVAVVRRLQGALTALEAVGVAVDGVPKQPDRPSLPSGDCATDQLH